jgi:glycosyltransferase involved in cell wall biosynthesis
MSQPTVTAVMLTANRPEFAARAVEAFRRQTYPAKRLMIWDSGDCIDIPEEFRWGIDVHYMRVQGDHGRTIGDLRNQAIGAAETPCDINSDIIVHWDDDDWSHPNRIAEQVALLQATGADCIGYNEMLFWRQATQYTHADYEVGIQPHELNHGEAWLYSNPNPRYALGTSLCYWRKAWEARPFPDLNHGEDTEWIRGLNCYAMAGRSLRDDGGDIANGARMIARIHSGNSSSAYDPIEMARHNALPRSERQWSRVPQWDKVCRKVMER